MVTLSEVMAGLSAEQRAAVEARYQALANELRETDEALGDYTVNLIRSLPEAAAKLRAENDTLRAIVGEQGERLFGLYAEEDRLAGRVIELEARVTKQADKIVRYEAELARVYLIANQYLQGRGCGHCRRIIEGRDVPSAGAAP